MLTDLWNFLWKFATMQCAVMPEHLRYNTIAKNTHINIFTHIHTTVDYIYKKKIIQNMFCLINSTFGVFKL